MYRRHCLKLSIGTLTLSVKPSDWPKQFLLGRKIILGTDLYPLEFIFATNKELPKPVSARITRWAISLMAFDSEIKHEEVSSIPYAVAMSRLNFDRDDDECNLVDYLSLNLDEFRVHFAEHKLIPIEELRSDCKRDELAKQIIRRVIDDDWKACTQVESIFKKCLVSSQSRTGCYTTELDLTFHQECGIS